PLTVPAFGKAQIAIRFRASTGGKKSAEADIVFSYPKGYERKVPLETYAETLEIGVTASHNVHVLPEQTFMYAIWATTPLDPFNILGYKLHLQFDPTYLTLEDISQDYTLSQTGWSYFDGDTGNYAISYQQSPS